MKMRIEGYIERHGLKKRDVSREGTWIPASLTVPLDDQFAVYANDDGTHIVVINTTKKRFKISHGDMVILETGWLDANISYQTDAEPFWR
jgi:hypothetical protein